MKHLFYALFAIFVLSSCNPYHQDNYKQYYVVESYLIANRQLPNVVLSKTEPLGQKYNYKKALISKANVSVRLLNDDSTVAETYNYRSQTSGAFFPLEAIRVKEKRLYQLLVKLPNGDRVSSITYVPGSFKTLNKLKDKYTYQGDQKIMLYLTPSSYITGRQAYYDFSIAALDTIAQNLTPFYKDLVSDKDTDIGNYFVNSSGIINQDNTRENDDGTLTLPLPWLSIAFYGRNKIITNALDNNMYDFLRTQGAQTGGRINFSPGKIQNITYHVSGGIGIFGSLASDTSEVTITQ